MPGSSTGDVQPRMVRLEPSPPDSCPIQREEWFKD